MAVRVAGFALGGGAEYRRHVVEALDVRLRGEVEVATVGLRLAGESVLEVLLGFRIFQRHEYASLCCSDWNSRRNGTKMPQ